MSNESCVDVPLRNTDKVFQVLNENVDVDVNKNISRNECHIKPPKRLKFLV